MAEASSFYEVSSNLAAQGIESGDLALDLILHDVAERTLQITGATGAAIALERDGALVCRAAAGSTAPDLGVRINIQSGLSGACVRERKLQWCGDCESDPRVDAAASRSLGVRSIVVMPLFVGTRMVGVFEIFSPQPDAFRDRDVKALQEIGRWVIDAVRGEVPGEEPSAAAQPTASIPLPVADSTPNEFASIEKSVELLQSRDQTTSLLRWVAIALAVVLAGLLALRWERSRSELASAHTVSTAAETAEKATNPRQTSSTTAVPNLELPNEKPKPSSGKHKGPTSNAALIAVERGEQLATQPLSSVQQPQVTEPKVSGVQPAAADSGQLSITQVASAAEAPPAVSEKELAAVGAAPLHALPPGFAAGVSAPTIKLPDPIVSQGVTEGRLIHSIQPKYPPDAMVRRLEGSVVLRAIIGKDGSIHDVKSVRGDRMLLQAATQAVLQWRYEPYKLNGAAVDMPIDITIKFSLPK